MGWNWWLGWRYMLRGQRAIQNLCARLGVKPLSLHPPLLRTPGWPYNEPDTIARAVAEASKVGCEVVVIHTSDAWREGNHRWQIYAAAMQTALAAAGPSLSVAVELSQFTKRTYRYAMDDVDAVLRFVEDQGEQVGITLDTAHTGANGDDLLAIYEKVRPRLRNIHLSDWVRRDGTDHTHLMPGNGALPMEGFLGTLARDAYAGLVTLEISPYHLHAWNLRQGRERLAESVSAVRSVSARGRTADV